MLSSMHDNKQRVTELFARFSSSDFAGALDMLTDDATWRIPGKPESMPVAGMYDKARLRVLFERMRARIKGHLKMTVLGALAEGEQVAAEVESSADLDNGRQYRQQYHFLIAFRDGKISTVREYFDTQHSYDVWFRK